MAFEIFHEAQARDLPRALEELRAGRKTSHWIWYVFPQLGGLGSSGMAVRFGLPDIASARAYLEDEALRKNLLEVTRAVHSHVVDRGADVEHVMGSHIDALKLVSSLTLFSALAAQGTTAAHEELSRRAIEILDVLAAQGIPRCAFTERALRAAGALPPISQDTQRPGDRREGGA